MIKNIIFDWSGTLSNDLKQVHKASSYTFKHFKLKPLTIKKFREEFVLPYMNFYSKYEEGIDKKECDIVFFKKFNSLKGPKPFLRAKKTLDSLHRKGIKMAILSSHPQKNVEKEIKENGFKKFFIGVNGGIYDKIKAIQKIMKKNGFDNKETAYVGDMTHDIEAGKKAKVITIAVSWGYQTKEKLLKKKPDFLIDNLDEIKNIIYIK